VRFKEFLKELAKDPLNYQHTHFQDEPVFAVQHMQYDTLADHQKEKCHTVMASLGGIWNGKDAYHFSNKEDADKGKKELNKILTIEGYKPGLPALFDLWESLNYKAKDLVWRKENEFNDRGTFKVADIEYEVRIDAIDIDFGDKAYHFLEVGFSYLNKNKKQSFARTNAMTASKVLGAVRNAAEEKIKEYEKHYHLDGILLGVLDKNDLSKEDAEKRYALYSRLMHILVQKNGYGFHEGINLPNGTGKYILMTKGKVPDEILKKIGNIPKEK